MTGSTVVIKIVGYVIWVGNTFKSSLVTRIAIGGSAGEPRRMARLTLQRGVSTCKRKVCRVMIKIRRTPGSRRMACRAVVVEIVGYVIWIGLLVGRRVA